MTSPLTPARAARRQLLRDRFAEQLGRWGVEYPAERARDLLDAVDDLGFRLPAAIEDSDPPPPRPSTPEGRAAARSALERALAARHAATVDDRTNSQPSVDA